MQKYNVVAVTSTAKGGSQDQGSYLQEKSWWANGEKNG